MRRFSVEEPLLLALGLLLLLLLALPASTQNVTSPLPSPGNTTAPLASPVPSNTTANSTNTTTEPEVNPLPPAACSTRSDETLTKDHPTLICVRVHSLDKKRMSPFYPKLDMFSLLTVNYSMPGPGGWPVDTSRLDNAPIMYIESMGVVSAGKLLASPDGKVLVNRAYVIIQVISGSVARIFWDPNPCDINKCGPGSGSEHLCVDDQCGVEVETCGSIDNCQVRVFVTWIGSDKKLVPLKSGAVRLSNWHQFTFAAAQGGLLNNNLFSRTTSGSDAAAAASSSSSSSSSSTPTPSPSNSSSSTSNDTTANVTARVVLEYSDNYQSEYREKYYAENPEIVMIEKQQQTEKQEQEFSLWENIADFFGF